MELNLHAFCTEWRCQVYAMSALSPAIERPVLRCLGRTVAEKALTSQELIKCDTKRCFMPMRKREKSGVWVDLGLILV